MIPEQEEDPCRNRREIHGKPGFKITGGFGKAHGFPPMQQARL